MLNFIIYTIKKSNRKETKGLELKYNNDGTYTVQWHGRCKDTDIIIPSRYYAYPITIIGRSAFKGREDVTSVVIPDTVNVIKECSFAFCKSLISVTMPNDAKFLGDHAFYKCKSLNSIVIPNNVKRIEHSTFYGCASLTNVTIPSTVTYIGIWVFAYCTSLTNITYNGTMAQWHQIKFFNHTWDAFTGII